MKKIATALLLVCLAAAMAAGNQAPRQFTVGASEVGEITFSGSEGQPISLDLVNPPLFHLKISEAGGYRIPVKRIELIGDGDGWTFALFASGRNSAWYDSLHVFNMGEADTIKVYGR